MKTFHSTLALDRTDRVVEGLRIPSSLDSTNAINFVLTQEPGKLKPKDLKIAIEKNRAERELRAEEQRKIREESGGGLGGLDLRGILSEEKLNLASKEGSNAFNRQLREIAFLADVEEVEKQEIEKEFRISEDYIGNNLLSDEDIQTILYQRELLAVHKKKSRWNSILERNHSILHMGHKASEYNSGSSGSSASSSSSSHGGEGSETTSPIKKTAKAPVIPLKAGTSIEIINVLMMIVKPQFDPNRNDIWSKRMNTLRRFLILTSRWIIRKRVEKRILKLLFYFHENNAFTREQVKAFILSENANARNMIIGSGKGSDASTKVKEKLLLTATQEGTTSEASGKPSTIDSTTIKTLNQFSFNDIFFSEMNSIKLRYEEKQEIQLKHRLLIKSGESEVTPSMIKRNLFPEYVVDILKQSKSSSSGMLCMFLSLFLSFCLCLFLCLFVGLFLSFFLSFFLDFRLFVYAETSFRLCESTII
jgi:hypothetical protein